MNLVKAGINYIDKIFFYRIILVRISNGLQQFNSNRVDEIDDPGYAEEDPI